MKFGIEIQLLKLIKISMQQNRFLISYETCLFPKYYHG